MAKSIKQLLFGTTFHDQIVSQVPSDRHNVTILEHVREIMAGLDNLLARCDDKNIEHAQQRHQCKPDPNKPGGQAMTSPRPNANENELNGHKDDQKQP